MGTTRFDLTHGFVPHPSLFCGVADVWKWQATGHRSGLVGVGGARLIF